MPTKNKSVAPVKDALAWAATHRPFTEHKLVDKTPWTKVYLLNGHLQRTTMTLTRPELSHTFKSTPALAQQFPALVPAVIAQNEDLGAQLLYDQGGARLDLHDQPQVCSLLASYAAMQGQARHSPHLLATFPALELSSLLPRLLQFLDPNADRLRNGARRYLGSNQSASFAAALTMRVDLLAALLNKAARLPETINHGDLQIEKIIRTSENTFVLNGWEHALAGPAGLSLHSLFGGCATPATLLVNTNDSELNEEAQRSRSLLDSYINGLEASHYASRLQLQECLAGAICAGAVHSVLWYADYPDDSSELRKTAKQHVESRLSDLLDLCDQLAVRDRNATLSCARDYASNGRRRRAEKILRRYISSHPNDAEVQARLARILQKRRKNAEAIAAYRKAIELQANDAQLHARLGDVLLTDLRFKEAEESFAMALRQGASRKRMNPRIDWSTQLRCNAEHAQREDVVPALRPTASELEAKEWLPEHLALGAKLFQQHGVLLVHNAFDKTLLDACNEDFVRRYAAYFSDKTHADALRIGDKRYQISLVLQGVFNDPALYANALIVAMMRQLLGAEFVLGCTVCATSLPGAKDQHWHKDHRSLYAKDESDPPMPLPPFAITTMIPLVELDEKIGTTSIKKGSHLLSKPDSEHLPEQLPMAPVGSCFLMDMRLSHRGLGNHTERVRPIVNMVYQRYWFSDSRNFEKHPPLRVSAAEYKKIPERHRYLFAWGTQPGPQVNR